MIVVCDSVIFLPSHVFKWICEKALLLPRLLSDHLEQFQSDIKAKSQLLTQIGGELTCSYRLQSHKSTTWCNYPKNSWHLAGIYTAD